MARKLGILAGGGDLPAQLINACRETGRDFFVIAFEGFAEKSMVEGVPHVWLRLGEAGSGFKILHDQGVEDVVMAGPVRRPSLRDLRPDWQTTRFLARIGMSALGDDGLLRAVIRELEDEGFRVVGIDDVLSDILARPGLYGSIEPDEQARVDIARGLEVARGLGRLDVGQSVVVQQGIVLAVEAVEGTDAMIARAGEQRRPGPGGVLVKTCKPGQERRADLPTVGPRTVQNAIRAGLRGIAIEAGSTLMVGTETMVAEADAAGLFLIGIESMSGLPSAPGRSDTPGAS
ncbi:LpxI family protein [Telmatospirillum sp. J64-1]|uniref:LpxI family protein n=1 Tax=Telmatospirillum sp. J64-1 TaxID=2502183 RepID=UPI00115E3C68|nr:UDP-2,3-diacylglucosamine diphosphatase LpxI [Telmatospirillum sp. J64-1]